MLLCKITKDKFSTDIGVDMRKACECYVNDDGTLFYGGFYHLCGILSEGRPGRI